MNQVELKQFADKFLSAWSAQDVDRVLDCYTEDVEYLDPSTRGVISGRDAMRSYLTKLFGRWTMHWELREGYSLASADGGAVLWRATLRPSGADEQDAVVIDGMDLVVMEADRIKRNDVYFDRTALAAFLAPTAGAS